GHRDLAPDLTGRLVLAETQVRRRAQPAVVRPLGALDLCHERRLDPDDVAPADLRHLRNLAEGRRLPPERPKLLEQLVDLLAVEARADVARVHELPGLVDAQHERAEARRAAAGPLRVAGDYELLLTVRLYFQPVAGAAADGVFRIDALRHDSFELLL